MPYHVSSDEFAELVERAIALLPEQFAAALEEVSIEIQTRPTQKMLRSVGLGRDELLLGLYTGVPLTERHVESPPKLPDVIHIFQEDIELCSDSKDELIEQVRITVLHEIGHYFGMDEDQLDELGYG